MITGDCWGIKTWYKDAWDNDAWCPGGPGGTFVSRGLTTRERIKRDDEEVMEFILTALESGILN